MLVLLLLWVNIFQVKLNNKEMVGEDEDLMNEMQIWLVRLGQL